MNKKQEYLNKVEYNLTLSPKACNEVINDLQERIEDEEKEGVIIDEIIRKMGTPQKLAKELNETYFTTSDIEYFEYKSNKESNFPLIHIVIKNKFNSSVNKPKIPVAKGVIAFGARSKGIISVGFFSQGIISLGFLSMGIISGGLISIGGLAIGIMALGGISIGTLSMGVMAIGNFLIGYATFGNLVAGKLAFGNRVSGNVEVSIGDSANLEQIRFYLREMVVKSKDYPLGNSFYKALLFTAENPLIFIIAIAITVAFLLGIFFIYKSNFSKISAKRKSNYYETI